MQNKLSNSKLLKQKVALGSYLDQLLHEATSNSVELEVENLIVPVVEEKVTTKPELTLSEIEILAPPEIASQVSMAPQESAVDTRSIRLTAEKFPLQCLMFWAGGNQLSVPLIRIKSILPWSDRLTRLPESPVWLLGLLHYHQSNIRVVDSTQILQLKPVPDRTPAHIIIIGDEEWAISCDKLENIVTLEYSDIQWSKKQQETLIYGTIRDSLASLLDPDAIIKDLESSTKQQEIASNG